jgi:hypothetical protein
VRKRGCSATIWSPPEEFSTIGLPLVLVGTKVEIAEQTRKALVNP